jgi:serine/threonine protein kinase
MPPRVIGNYQILSVLGSGGIGSVYRAMDKRTNEEVALKLLSSGPALDPVAARRMAREFEALYELSHPNVVRVFDTGVYRGYPFLTMELIEGLTLREFLMVDHTGLPAMLSAKHLTITPRFEGFDEVSDSGESVVPFNLDRLAEEPDSDLGLFAGEHVSGHGPEALRRLASIIDEPFTDDGPSNEVAASVLPAPTEREVPRLRDPNLGELNRPERVALLKDALLQICDALAYIHARGMVHRDLKPSNIMVDEDRRVKLMDFGLAKFLAEDTAVTGAGRIVGTYRYMAPEQLLGERLDGRSDLYSMGVMLYELLAGRPPFDAKTPVEMCQRVLEQEAVPLLAVNPDVEETLARVAHRLMHKDPGERYQTAEEVYEVLFE